MAEPALAKLILDAILEYNETRRGGASLFHLEYNFSETNPEEISTVLERLVEEGKIVKENYLYYPVRK
jgi:hypothetical protein